MLVRDEARMTRLLASVGGVGDPADAGTNGTEGRAVMAESVRFATLVKRWMIGLFAACLLAVGVYVLMTRSGEGSSFATIPLAEK